MFIKRFCAAIIYGTLGVSAGFLASRTVLAADTPKMPDGTEQTKMDKLFFDKAASGNTLEIRLAKLAQERSTDLQVKQLAMTIQQDHEQANVLLKNIADKHHIDVSPDELTPAADATYKEMKDMQGDLFTRAYLFQQVGQHAEDELLLSYHSNHGSEASRDYSNEVLPKVQMHLHALEQIARPMAGLNAIAETAGGHMNSDMK